MMLLRRNRFGFRMRRRNVSSRLIQCLVVVAVITLFVYLLLYAFNSNRDHTAPDYSWLKTRNMSAFILPHKETILLQPKSDKTGSAADFCLKSEKMRLLVVICSAPHNFERRRIIRKTWGLALKQYPGVKVVFILGLSKSVEIQNDIEKESDLNNDVVQHNFVDNYMNLTLKTGFMLKWVNKRCLATKFVFKVDDDVFVNPEILWKALDHALLHTTTTRSLEHFMQAKDESSQQVESQSESVDYLLMGHVMTSVPIRDVTSKWYLPSRFYPLNIFPMFVSGTGYVMTTSIVPMLYQCLLRTPYMNLEDVFLTGLCGTTQMGLHLSHNPDFRWKKPALGPNYICYYKNSALLHSLEAHEVEEMWVRVQDDHNCDTFYFGFVKIFSRAIELVKNIFRL